LLCAVLLLTCVFFPMKASAATNIFVALNDRLLPLDTTPYYHGGEYYLPLTVFRELGVSYSYFSDSSTALLYSGSLKFFFDLANGTCFDANDNFYSASAVYRSSVVYVPVDFVCRRFGLGWSYIEGNEYGDILRVKNDDVILSDKVFLSAARDYMQYYAKNSGASPSPGQPSDVSPSPDVDKSGVTVCLSFTGLPEPDILNLLEQYDVQVCFFVSAENIRQNADIIRRAVVSGHKLGVLLDPEDCGKSLDDTLRILFEAAHITTVLAAAPDDDDEEICQKFAYARGLAFRTAGIVADVSGENGLSDITEVLALCEGAAYIRLPRGEGAAEFLRGLLDYLKDGKFNVSAFLEV